MTVREYLVHTGGASLADICRDLHIISTDARKALRASCAREHRYCASWPKASWPGILTHVNGNGPYRAPASFVLWHLPRSLAVHPQPEV